LISVKRQQKNKNENFVDYTKKRKYDYLVGQRIEEEISKHWWRKEAVMDHQVTQFRRLLGGAELAYRKTLL
jgi:hypothetical protein